MKKLLLIFFVLLLLPKISLAESSECDKEIDHKEWTNCIGTITSLEGRKYVGEFKDGKYHGQGTETYKNGRKYVGEWKDGKKNGQGTETYFNGDEYVGEWKDGKYHGQGIKMYGDGEYTGEYKDGKRHGQGTYTLFDGTKYVGEWKDDEIVETPAKELKVAKPKKYDKGRRDKIDATLKESDSIYLNCKFTEPDWMVDEPTNFIIDLNNKRIVEEYGGVVNESFKTLYRPYEKLVVTPKYFKAEIGYLDFFGSDAPELSKKEKKEMKKTKMKLILEIDRYSGKFLRNVTAFEKGKEQRQESLGSGVCETKKKKF